jgi:hypothetical protein
MPLIHIQSPMDQPSGRFRLLNEIKQNLASNYFTDFRFITAFAKVGPFLRLESELQIWRRAGKTVEAIFGVDQKGTSRQALDFALTAFDNSYIANIGTGVFSPTFHPKIYLFQGNQRAAVYIGSNNFTLGGMETNAESMIKIELTLPADQSLLTNILRCWTDTLNVSLPLDVTLLAQLAASQLVIDEKQMRKNKQANHAVTASQAITTAPTFPAFRVIPPSPIPQTAIPRTSVPRKRSGRASAARPNLNDSNTQALVIQIVPHHNGEIFLSKIAVNQNPSFFGYPFSGRTSAKKASNPSYPQRLPDPQVNITVFNVQGSQIASLPGFGLNMVYYSTKSEIRITIPPSVGQQIPSHSIMVMRETGQRGIDYDIYIYPPQSLEFTNYLAVCNHTMPSGGGVPRRFGWI